MNTLQQHQDNSLLLTIWLLNCSQKARFVVLLDCLVDFQLLVPRSRSLIDACTHELTVPSTTVMYLNVKRDEPEDPRYASLDRIFVDLMWISIAIAVPCIIYIFVIWPVVSLRVIKLEVRRVSIFNLKSHCTAYSTCRPDIYETLHTCLYRRLVERKIRAKECGLLIRRYSGYGTCCIWGSKPPRRTQTRAQLPLSIRQPLALALCHCQKSSEI